GTAPTLRWLACRSAVPPRAMPGATSRRTPPRAASPRSARRAGSRRAGSSCGSPFAEKSRQIDRVALQFLEEDEQPMIGHPLRVEDPVEVIALVLDDPGVKALDLAVDALAVEAEPAIADAQVPRNDPAQPGDRKTALPADRALLPEELDHRVDQHREILRAVARHLGDPLLGHLEEDDPVRLVHLRCGDAGAAGILHRLDHVFDQPPHPGCGRIIDRGGDGAQYGMAHAGDLQQSHGAEY